MADLCGDRNSDASRTFSMAWRFHGIDALNLDGIDTITHSSISPQAAAAKEAAQRLDLIKSSARARARAREMGCHASIAGSASAILRVRTRVKLFFFCLFIHTVYSHSKLRNQGPSAASRVR